MKSKLKFILVIVCFFLLSCNKDQDINKRFDNFIKEIRCVVCQNQSLADSHAPLADDLRAKIYTLMIHKKTDEEIKDYLTARYGDFILLNPRFNTVTILLWLFPFLGLGIAILLIYMNKRQDKN